MIKIGDRFDHLLVIMELEERKRGAILWLCQCDCGNAKKCTAYNLVKGRNTSCGCKLNNMRKAMVASREERFWAKVDKTPGLGPNGDCWEWTAAKVSKGYGYVNWKKIATPAHRVAYAFTFGWDTINGMFVCHACDNPPCVNPEHLWLGTIQDNNRDKAIKGRTKNMYLVNMSSLKNWLKEKIVILHRTGLINVRELAKAFNLSDGTVVDILEKSGEYNYKVLKTEFIKNFRGEKYDNDNK